jgi:hypothetical protein
MLTIIGSLLGFAGSAVPSVLDYFKGKQEKNNQLEVIRLQADLAKQNADIDLIKFQAQALDNEHARLIEHDIALQNDTGFFAGMRKSVRPMITYLFFGIFAAIKITGIVVIIGDAEVLNATTLNSALLKVWDGETQAMFAAIISFWFGSRAIEKGRQLSKG